jgi:phosphate transport system permease protein
VYRNVRKPDVEAIARGFTGAFVLMLLVLALFVIARIVGRDRTKRRAAPRRRRLFRTSPLPPSPLQETLP